MSLPDAEDPFHRAGADRPVESLGDESAVHGLLSLLLPGEAEAIDRRVNRAMSSIRKSEGRLRIRPRRLVVWIGGSVGIAAAIALAILFVPTGSDSRAYAAFESIRAHARDGTRLYQLRIDSGDPTQPTQPTQPTRHGDLVVGTGGRWTLGFRPPLPRDAPLPPLARNQQVRAMLGFDGTSYWMIRPDGEVRTAATVKELKGPRFLEELDPPASGTNGDPDDLEPLMLDTMLEKLDRGYITTFDAPSAEEASHGRPVTVVSLASRQPQQRLHGPRFVRIVADASSHEIIRATSEWIERPAIAPAGPRRPLIRRVDVSLVEDVNPTVMGELQSPRWFERDFQQTRAPRKFKNSL